MIANEKHSNAKGRKSFQDVERNSIFLLMFEEFNGIDDNSFYTVDWRSKSQNFSGHRHTVHNRIRFTEACFDSIALRYPNLI